MIEQVVTEAGKGFFRGIAYLIAELVFWRLCYLVGWPICKLFTFGAYPKRVYRERSIFREERSHTGFTCCAVGFLTLVAIALYLSGSLPKEFYQLL